MKKKIYAVVDLETTGGRANRDKITEIAIIKHDGEKIIDSYETLINPERTIPYNITQITGINDEKPPTTPVPTVPLSLIWSYQRERDLVVIKLYSRGDQSKNVGPWRRLHL